MVISIVDRFLVKKVLVDQGSSTDLLYLPTLRKMGILKKELKPFHGNLIGFFGEQVGVKGYVDLLTSFIMSPLIKTIDIRYLVIDYQTSYNTFLSQPSLNTLGAIVSTPHLAMKFLVSDTKIVAIHVNQKEAR